MKELLAILDRRWKVAGKCSFASKTLTRRRNRHAKAAIYLGEYLRIIETLEFHQANVVR